MKELTKIGFISKAHGIKGEVFIRLFDKEDSYLTKKVELVIKEKAYAIEKLRRAKDGLIIKLKDVDTRNDSETFKGLEVFVVSSVFQENTGDGVYLNQLKGFEVYLAKELKGKVSGFSETAAHDLLVIELETEGEVEIPYVESFIENIDKDSKKIYVTCPEELFDTDFLNGAKK